MNNIRSTYKNVIVYSALLEGTLNGESIIVTGSGTINNGTTSGTYELVNFPTIVDPKILETVLITGYPNACKPLNKAINVFGNGSYFYEREVTFSNGGNFKIKVDCQREGNTLNSLFKLEGICDEISLEKCEPLIEIWEPTTSELKGNFKIFWKKKDGNYFYGDAKSIYSPKSLPENLPLYHRYIQIDFKKQSENKFSLLQKSKLFDRL